GTKGERIGKVIRCDPETFVVEKGVFFPKDYELRYDYIVDSKDGTIVYSLSDLLERERQREIPTEKRAATVTAPAATAATAPAPPPAPPPPRGRRRPRGRAPGRRRGGPLPARRGARAPEGGRPPASARPNGRAP